MWLTDVGLMRLFVALRPPEPVLDDLETLISGLVRASSKEGRGQGDGLRWASRDQWHVTLRFLGDVEDPAEVVDALGERRRVGEVEAVLGPRVGLLGRSVLCLPVAGVDELADSVIAATAGIGRPPDDRPFRGHLTLARLRRGRASEARPCVGGRLEARWAVGELEIVRSHTDPEGARYETVARLG